MLTKNQLIRASVRFLSAILTIGCTCGCTSGLSVKVERLDVGEVMVNFDGRTPSTIVMTSLEAIGGYREFVNGSRALPAGGAMATDQNVADLTLKLDRAKHAQEDARADYSSATTRVQSARNRLVEAEKAIAEAIAQQASAKAKADNTQKLYDATVSLKYNSPTTQQVEVLQKQLLDARAAEADANAGVPLAQAIREGANKSLTEAAAQEAESKKRVDDADKKHADAQDEHAKAGLSGIPNHIVAGDLRELREKQKIPAIDSLDERGHLLLTKFRETTPVELNSPTKGVGRGKAWREQYLAAIEYASDVATFLRARITEELAKAPVIQASYQKVQAVKNTSPGFGGFASSGVHTISPDDPNYARVLGASANKTPISAASTTIVGNSTVIFVQESPTQMRVYSIDADGSKLVQNVLYITDKALQAAVKYAKP